MNTQETITWKDEAQKAQAAARLEALGFVDRTAEGGAGGVNVFCVDRKEKCFFRINAACAAARAAAGLKTHPAEDIDRLFAEG